MNDHVHCILQPIAITNKTQAGTPVRLSEYYSLSQITHGIKSYSANRLQRLLNKKGSIWQDENYDRVIRNENEYLQKMNYIIYNPVKSGLVDKIEDYKWFFLREIT
jgi:REP element-mobilizing transposase RayT